MITITTTTTPRELPRAPQAWITSNHEPQTTIMTTTITRSTIVTTPSNPTSSTKSLNARQPRTTRVTTTRSTRTWTMETISHEHDRHSHRSHSHDHEHNQHEHHKWLWGCGGVESKVRVERLKRRVVWAQAKECRVGIPCFIHTYQRTYGSRVYLLEFECAVWAKATPRASNKQTNIN